MFYHSVNYKQFIPDHENVPKIPKGYQCFIQINIEKHGCPYSYLLEINEKTLKFSSNNGENYDNTEIYKFYPKSHMRDFYVIDGEAKIKRENSIALFLIEEAGIYFHLYKDNDGRFHFGNYCVKNRWWMENSRMNIEKLLSIGVNCLLVRNRNGHVEYINMVDSIKESDKKHPPLALNNDFKELNGSPMVKLPKIEKCISITKFPIKK
jgi:hypothetical protein